MSHPTFARRRGFRSPPVRRRVLASLLSLLLTLTCLPAARATAQEESGATVPGQAKLPTVEFVPGQVLVRFRADSAVADVSGDRTAALAMRAEGGREIVAAVESFAGSELVEGLRLARVPVEDTLRAVAALSARPDVEFAEPDYIWRAAALPNDTQFDSLWGLKNTGQVGNNDVGCPPNQACPQPGVVGEDIDAELAWNTTTGSSSVVVAVLDGGVDTSHPDLQPNIWTNPGEIPNDNVDNDGNGFVDDTNGWDFAHNDRTVFDGEDGDDHGTHVAGTIGARGNNGQGVAGVNWQVRIMSVKVLGASGGSTSGIVSGYNYVRTMRERGVNVRATNNSYGGFGFSQTAFAAIQQLNNAGILFVAAAGNDAVDNFTFPHFPSDYDLPNMVSVAATDRFGQMAVFSNFGGRAVHMAAPGRGVLSTVPAFVNGAGVITEGGGKYAFFSGTSMAAPHVTGAAALALSVNPNISVQNLRGALVYSGDVLPSLQGRTTGGRRLNVAAAVGAATESGGAADTTPPAAPSDLQAVSVNGREVTLRWTAPGDDGASGTAADYDFISGSIGGQIIVPTSVVPAPGGTTQTATVTLPYLVQNAGIKLRVFDNAGNVAETGFLSVFIGQNSLNDPYITATNTGPAALSTGGTSLNLNADDRYLENHALPFAFPFYGQTHTAVTVSTNGALYFSTPPKQPNGDAADLPSSFQGLRGQRMIAGLWDDIRTDRPNGGVFVLQPDSARVIYRWQAVTFGSEVPVNFEIELNVNGTIIFRYGAGQSAPVNTQLFSTVGISAGEPDPYIISSHSAGTVPRSLTNAPAVTFTPRPASPTTFTISGRVTDGAGNGIDAATVTLSGAQSRVTTTDANGNYAFNGLPAGDYLIGPSKSGQFTAFGQTVNGLSSDRTVDLTLIPFIFVAGQIRDAQNNLIPGAGYTVTGVPAAHVANTDGTYTVGITPRPNAPITITPVKYGYTFTPASATFNDLAAGNQSGTNFTGTLNNPIDASTLFVTQHYRDFLGREPDAPGLDFWRSGIEQCGPGVSCTEVARVNTSAAFFLSIEFQETGVLVYRMWKAAYGNVAGTPIPVRRADFVADAALVGQNVQVGVGNWQEQLEANKRAYADTFAGRAAFTGRFGAMTNTQYVEALDLNAEGALSPAERQALIDALNGGTMTRAQVLRAVAENERLRQSQLRRAFVLMQYFGYLRRDPDAPDFRGEADPQFLGYSFWLGKLNEFDGNYEQAEMVKAFITSIEYRRRFGQ